MQNLCPRMVAALWMVLATAAPALAARDYYVNIAGNDANSGASPTDAFQSINRLNFVAFEPGDRVLLEGGTRFSGNLLFDAGDVGTAANPIVITSYGSGRATILAGATTGIQIYNTAGIRITNLAIVGAGRAANSGNGISAFTDLAGDVKLPLLHIEDVDVSDFGKSGIEIGGNNGASGFQDVTIKFVATWNNGRDGIMSYGPVVGTHRTIYVGYCKSFSNPGINHQDSSGSGIVLGAVDGAIIERSVSTNNGTGAIGPHGPIGIWVYHSNNVTIQFNESHNNRTGGWADGGGFGLDVGVTNSTVQYNYSHGNDGAGFLLAGGFDPADHANNIVRYNISENDGRRNGFGALEIWGKTRNTHIYNNTVFTAADAAFEARAIYITNGYADGNYPVGVSFRNNILYATGGIPNVHVNAPVLAGASLRFENNNYYSSTGEPRITWGNATYGSVSAWAAATGQETGSAGVLGTSVDPMLAAPGGGPTLGDANRLDTVGAYTLRGASPLVDTGQDLSSVGLAAPRDFYGTPVPHGARPDVGAHEWTAATEWTPPGDVVIYASDVSALFGDWRHENDATAAGGVKLTTSDLGWSNTTAALAAPAHYFDVTFTAEANTKYRIWLRLRARNDSKFNDAVFVQFSDAIDGTGAPIYRIGTTTSLTVNMATCSTCALQGWGWQNRAYWLNDAPDVWFATAGTRTLRVQVREDGVEVDQVILSPAKYSNAPGPVVNDTTIVPKPSAETPPPPPPNRAPAVALNSPADGSTFSAPATVALSAAASDADGGVVRVEFYADSALIGTRDTTPYSTSWTNVPAGSYTLTAVAVDTDGARTQSGPIRISVSAPTTTPPEIVVYAGDIVSPHGWTRLTDATAAGGSKLSNPDQGWSSTAAPPTAPTQYFDVTFTAQANTRYRLWLRLRAQADSKFNDSLYVQFSDAVSSSGAAVYRIGTSTALAVNLATCSTCPVQAWGWQNRAYWLSDTGDVWFPTSGSRTLRVQIREDGVELDQIVLSPSRYLNTAPGALTNDATIVPKPAGDTPPPNSAPSVSLTSPSDGATFTAPAMIAVSAAASDADGSVARVDFYAGGTLIGSRTAAPYSVSWSGVPGGTYSLTAVAVDDANASRTSAAIRVTVTAPTSAPAEIVVYARDVASPRGWTLVSDASAADGMALSNPEQAWSSTSAALAAPTQYFDVTFTAQANTRYRLWLRLRAQADSKFNDSVYVQFSDAVNSSGAAVYRVGTTAGLTVNLATCGTCAVQGWGWQNRAYWLADQGEVWFPTTGTRTLRIQVREDGVDLDQIILSPARYLNSAPGAVTNDRTIVPKP